jgi:hypothetical protein
VAFVIGTPREIVGTVTREVRCSRLSDSEIDR